VAAPAASGERVTDFALGMLCGGLLSSGCGILAYLIFT
jgi:hypothetical protein